MRKAFCLAVLIALPVHQPAAQTASGCVFPQKPVVLMQEGEAHQPGSRLLQFWEMDDAPVVWSSQVPAGYGDFRAGVKRHVRDTDAVRLLAQNPSVNNRLVAQNAGRWIYPVVCLEMLLQGTQHARIDTFKTPTEFASFVLRSNDGKRLRVYFHTVNQDGIGRMSPLTGPVAKDIKAGWRVLFTLHSHNFHPGQPQMNGIVAPSVPDAHFAQNVRTELALPQARITNGVSTVRIPASAFAQFEREEKKPN
jgi:hypothetical protein